MRLFFTKDEIEKLASGYTAKTGLQFTPDKIKILQFDADKNIANPISFNDCKFITPQLFSYGFQAQTIVAEFNVEKLLSGFYLSIQLK